MTYRVRSGLLDILAEAGISVGAFRLAAGFTSNDTFHRVAHPRGPLTDETRQKVVEGVARVCGEQYRARAEALWARVPDAMVKILGGEPVRKRLRELSAKHGLTMYEFLNKVFENGRDPLEVMALKTGGRRKASV